MAGGPSSDELIIATAEAGALASIGAAYLSPESIRQMTARIRSKTQGPLNINLFVPSKSPAVSEESLRLALDKNVNFRKELGLLSPKMDPPYEEDFDQQFQTLLSLKPRVFSFVFGTLSSDYIRSARQQGIYIIGTATTLEEALKLQDIEVDAIVAQGFQAGGHRGIFDSAADDPGIETFDLVRAMKKSISLPIIAAGGLMTKRDIEMAFQSGAEAVQMGTAFLTTQEAGTPSPYRRKLLENENRETKLTRAFSGRLARGIVNRYMHVMDQDEKSILPFPVQNKFTRDLRAASAVQGSADFLSLWCGAGPGKLWTGSTKDLIDSLMG